ncbi:hypothetical protein NC652_035823 [Populus alba x Populus x berolinensis]|nr:hypothetical protein NC652_035823 [Populus alba x Populus x berolinensis]
MLVWSYVDGWMDRTLFSPPLNSCFILGNIIEYNTKSFHITHGDPSWGMCSFLGEAIDDECKGRPMRIYIYIG